MHNPRTEKSGNPGAARRGSPDPRIATKTNANPNSASPHRVTAPWLNGAPRNRVAARQICTQMNKTIRKPSNAIGLPFAEDD